jgi:hypothetical protein
MNCGKENADQAAFCVGCGTRFPDSAVAETPLFPAAAQAGPTMVFTAEMGAGAHKHMFTDVYLRDSAGTLLMVARRSSLIHENFAIVDSSEKAIGYLEHKEHLGHSSLMVQDENHNPMGSFQVSNVRKMALGREMPPSCWFEDAGGNKTGTLVFTGGLLGFSAVRLDGSKIFDASLSGGGGFRQTMSAMERRSYAINLVDPGFSQTWLLTAIAAIDHISFT